jgi:hypothetical protein
VITFTVPHRQSLAEARRRLESTVQQVSRQLGALVQRIEWSADRSRVRLDGAGSWIELWVDAQAVHGRGDVPILGGLLGGTLGPKLEQIARQTFQKELP